MISRLFGSTRNLFLGLFILCSFAGLRGAEAAQVNPGWQQEWEKTVAAANKEGELMFYGSDKYPTVFSQFEKRFPQIKVRSVVGTARDYTHRLMMEKRAGKYLADLYINGGSSGYFLYKAKMLDPIGPALILPEVVNESLWWQGRHHYKDNEGKYVFAFNGEFQPYFSYNSKLVNPEEIKSFWDLLDPKWKGKILIYDPTVAGAYSALRFIYYHPELGPKYLKRLLGEMDVTASRDKAQIVNWVGTGKYPIFMFSDAQRMDFPKAREQGIPINWFGPRTFKEGTILGAATGVVGLINQAPHPNAAKVAINWLLSKEGQLLYQKVWAKADSLRIDIPKDDVPEYSRRQEGVNAVDTDRPQWMDMKEIVSFVKEVWKR